MNMALEWLLANRTTGNLHFKKLDLNVEMSAHLNEAQAVEAIKQATDAIKQAEVCDATTVCTLQKAHRDSVLVMEHQMKTEERWDCQAFMEAFGVAIQVCLPKTWGTLLYPLQLLNNDVPLATLLGMSAATQLWAVADGGLAQASSIPSVSEMPVPQMGAKHWCHSSDQGVPTLMQDEEEMVVIDDLPKECPHCMQNEGRPVMKAIKEPHQEAFSKKLEVMKVVRWAYYKAHWPNFEQEGLYDLFSTF